MLARQRQAVILEETRRRGAVRVSDLVGKSGVADMTVRRDLVFHNAHGIAEQAGLTVPNLIEREATAATLSEIDLLAGDDKLDDRACEVLSTHVGELVTVSARSGGRR
ncbi:DeoR family transcriptional regulator [Saccharomonospora sp.]|uniref:DeoR family transcriptional regulator n=1 Tax=Saccharomonospora sp. TaxID=33913 RepID=UPI002639B5B2|nr:DeoR family transcriptional regulator [Saccharomonospora sp.]